MKHKLKKSLDDLDAIGLMINEVIGTTTRCDLLVEAIWSAMSYLKQNPKASIKEACEYGVGEWIK